MPCDPVAVGPTAPTSTDRRRRSTTGSSAGQSAAYGKAFSAHLPGPKTHPINCLSTVPASRCIVVRAVEKGALAHGIGRTKGGRNTKLHAVCDEKGRPCVLFLTPGNVNDC